MREAEKPKRDANAVGRGGERDTHERHVGIDRNQVGGGGGGVGSALRGGSQMPSQQRAETKYRAAE